MFFNVGNTSYATSVSYTHLENAPAFLAGGGGGGAYSNNMYIPYWTEERPSNKYPAAHFSGDGRFKGLQSRAFVRLQDKMCIRDSHRPTL